jgi:chaperonin GroES
MAIDKNVFQKTRTSAKALGPEQQLGELQKTLAQEQKPPIEMTETEDGGVEIDFDPNAMAGAGTVNHDENLTMFLEEEILQEVSNEILEQFDSYKASRKDWEDTYTKGLDLLGFKYENRAEPFQGASGATHPVLAEAVTQFQALAYKELLPASGPVRTQIVGKVDEQREMQAERVKEFMNYQLMVNMKEYEPEFDQMLFNLPLSGSTFKKVYFDGVMQRCVSKFVPAEDLYVPYSATSLEDAECIIHSIKMTGNDVLKQQLSGFYREIDLSPDTSNPDDVTDKKDDITGFEPNRDEVFTILEAHCELDIPGFEDMNMETQEPTGLKLPYIVTIDEGSGRILSIRRNYNAQDPTRTKRDYFVHFKFLPGLGFYGFGLIHMIGGLSRTATAALRQLLDAGTLANLPSGFKMRGIRVRDEAQPLQPGEFRDVDAPGGNLRDAFMPLPFKGPNPALLQLLDFVVNSGQRFASIADMQVGDGNQGAAVGTTVALLERGSRVMSAIHKRLYQSMKCEFMLLANTFKTYLPPIYPYDVVGGQKQVKQTDFDDRIDIIPVADPNVFSQTQRITVAQTQLQLAMSNPKMHNMYQAYRDMYEALGVKDIDLILKKPQPPAPVDPAVENMMALAGTPFKAYPGQDHKAHMDAHLSFMGTQIARTNPQVLGLLQKNILEHIALMGTEQVQLEFKSELERVQQITLQTQQMTAQMGPNPQAIQQNPQFMALQQEMQQLNTKMEARKAQLIAEIMAEYLEEEKKVLNQLDTDPLLRLKNEEVQLRAKEEARKQEEGETKAQMEALRLISNREVAEEKLAQDDKHAKLRASVSLAKDGIKQMNAVVKEES